jgi:hypothetical protein
MLPPFTWIYGTMSGVEFDGDRERLGAGYSGLVLV